MRKLARKIVCWWYYHDLNQVDDIVNHWKPGFIFTRIKFEIAVKLLGIIGWCKGMNADSDEFIMWAMSCPKGEC